MLNALDQLDGESGFVPDLIAIFRRDSVAILQGLEEAVECRDSQRFTELANILMDNAGQLGAFALFEICLTLQQISQRELERNLETTLAQLNTTVEHTNRAFQDYLAERQTQQTDRS